MSFDPTEVWNIKFLGSWKKKTSPTLLFSCAKRIGSSLCSHSQCTKKICQRPSQDFFRWPKSYEEVDGERRWHQDEQASQAYSIDLGIFRPTKAAPKNIQRICAARRIAYQPIFKSCQANNHLQLILAGVSTAKAHWNLLAVLLFKSIGACFKCVNLFDVRPHKLKLITEQDQKDLSCVLRHIQNESSWSSCHFSMKPILLMADGSTLAV